ncbi:L-threonylcarbamoyladenylate synthase [Dethiobacter alkaliphilus]|uniref:L-threonylcarbamoyladenylate synthase n=1 Tax=Dethiobacter alkaliphilus TaxID=427926 RepID=UPI0022264B64|nr:L-threonylcarbamoyladenylate synthase [Dethiobacter alkaliphilus]MCW3488876.1 L-threonylcarbamoyladenylate synthase [Dethiobacter alkaliphilus]
MAGEKKLHTRVLDARDINKAQEQIAQAGRILAGGGLVAFPTETVYGLGANALNGPAVENIFIAKGRPSDNPLIVHVDRAEKIRELAQNIPPEAWCLAEHFWPGPLTLVLPKQEIVPREVSGGLKTVAVRIPDHPVALAFLKAAGVPVAAPSANLSGRPSPTTAGHVLDDLAGRIDAVVDGGPCGVGVESTVLSIENGQPVVLRPGGITPEQISRVLGKVCAVAAWQEQSGDAPPSPGLKYTHYAPQAPMYLLLGNPEAVAEKMQAMRDDFQARGQKVGLLLSRELSNRVTADVVEVLGERDRRAELAANLYGALRRLDETECDVILAEGYTDEGMGFALMNRMAKAAGPRVLCLE